VRSHEHNAATMWPRPLLGQADMPHVLVMSVNEVQWLGTQRQL
jgi:hypothetical protein